MCGIKKPIINFNKFIMSLLRAPELSVLLPGGGSKRLVHMSI